MDHPLYADLLKIRDQIYGMNKAHSKEIGRTIHATYHGQGKSAFHKSEWPLSRDAGGLEDAIDQMIDTYEGANNLGRYAPRPADTRAGAIEAAADARSER